MAPVWASTPPAYYVGGTVLDLFPGLTLTEEDLARAESLLADASDLVREIGRASWTEAGGANPAPASIRLIVKRAALRAFNEDPEGYTSETLGDWSGRREAPGSPSEIGVYFTADEMRAIRGASGKPAGVFSIRTPSAYASDVGQTLYAPVAGGSAVPWLSE